MAHESRLSVRVNPAVAGEAIQEGRLVKLVASGLYEDLQTARLASSGNVLNVFVAFVPPDNFARPTRLSMYTARRNTQWYETDSWGNDQINDTFLNAGLSTFDNPFLSSGYTLLAKAGGTYTVPSGCVVASANIKVAGNYVKVADDGTGRWEYTANESVAIGRVLDWDPSAENYTFESIRL